MKWLSRAAIAAALRSPGFWRRAGLWLLLLTLAPFAIEIIILADLVGIELAMAFVAYWARDTWTHALARWQRLCDAVAAAGVALAMSLPFERRSFSVLCSFTLVMVALGLPAMGLLGWYPMVFVSPLYGGYS